MPVDYSSIARYYDDVRVTSPDYLKFWSSKIAKYGTIDSDSKVLDIGCGTGRFTLMISDLTGAEIYANDPSVEMLKKARMKDKKKKVFWKKGRAEDLPFQDDFFDCAYMTFVFHHIKNRRSSLVELNRILRPGGKCIILTTSHSHIMRSPLYLFPGLSVIDLERFPSLPDLKTILNKESFKNVHYHIDKYQDMRMPTDEYLGLVRQKHVSTLTMLSDKEFADGYKIFEKRLRKKYKDYVDFKHGLYLVTGEK